MKQIFSFLIILLLFALTSNAQKVVSIKIDGTINPVAADFIHRAIEKTKNEKAQCLIIHLNTPGGLLQSTRIIVSDILESPVPIVVYVAPAGAHSGSAGVFITLCAHISAMGPGKKICGAHPLGKESSKDTIMKSKGNKHAAAIIHT